MPSDPPIPHELTQILHRWKEGDREAFQKVVTLAYDDLRAIATGLPQPRRPKSDAQATGLANESLFHQALALPRGESCSVARG